MQNQLWVSRATFVVIAGAVILTARPAAAQTRFEWKTVVDVSTYRTVDECLGATARVADSVTVQESIRLFRDTLPMDVSEPRRPLPAVVVETARRCAARFVEPNTPRESYGELLALYLEAGRDADATALVSRWLAALPSTARAQRRALTDTALRTYIGAKPPRVESALRVLDERLRTATGAKDRVEIYGTLMEIAMQVMDTARSLEMADRVLAEAEQLTRAQRDSLGGEWLSLALYSIRMFASRSERLDSLRRGPQPYVALDRLLWTRTTGLPPEAHVRPVGRHAPPLAADFWFPLGDSGTSRPSRGRVALVYFADLRECIHSRAEGDRICATQWAVLRRLGERFPELEMTVVTQTNGYFGESALEAAVEAEWHRRFLQQEKRIRASVAVALSEYISLATPDRRRIRLPAPVFGTYAFGGRTQVAGAMYLIDRDGTIIHTDGATTSAEREMGEMISIMLGR